MWSAQHMGDEITAGSYSREERQRYREKVQLCLDVFERMLGTATFEADRENPMTGLEVELNLVDAEKQPFLGNTAVLEEIADPAFQTERGADIVMVGILPTLMTEHLARPDWMSPSARYSALNDMVFAARGEDVHLDIHGVERLSLYASTLAPESACTSVQLHLQVAPTDFAKHWNAAQVLAGPQLALGANSPFFFGRELWRETRIELFAQSTDTRPQELKNQGVRPRVWFGERWIKWIFDPFEENVRYFQALLPEVSDEDPAAEFENGRPPRLQELRLHNGTIYRWNRPVYEVVDGRPHVRVENRVLPAGPTVVDVLANAAFYYGALRVLADDERPVWSKMTFSAAEDNFHAGARDGIEARLYWPGVGEAPA